ncbi:efflux RND transporter permease subunit [Alienimonas sp. DA493]|uniref:efflux RND transporter permease subunit n=1 Tax=Alienimonas sp. DA493 TaxID=3373605 RepID=UPI0037542ACC
MLDAVIRFALRNRVLVLAASVATLVYGALLAAQMPIDVFPDLDRPRVILLTEARGLATEEVETLVTYPLEIALLGASGVEDVRSQSTAGLSVVYVEFGWDTEIRDARRTVQERLATLAGVLPEGVVPQMTPPSSIMGQIVVAGLSRQAGPRGGTLYPIESTGLLLEALSEGEADRFAVWRPTDRRRSATWDRVADATVEPATGDRVVLERLGAVAGAAEGEDGGTETPTVRVTLDGRERLVRLASDAERRRDLRTIADWIVRPRLRKVTGVAEAFVLGGDRKQYQVRIDPAALLEYGVSLQDVEEALHESNINTSGGFAVTGETERPIRVLGRLGPRPERVVQELRAVPVGGNERRPVLLGQVAEVVEAAEFKRGDGSVNGRPGVVFTVVKQPHVDTRGLTDRVEAALADVEDTLTADLVVTPDLFQLRGFIDRGVFNVGEALAIGAGLVVVVLFLFLLNVRTTFITLTAIPLSLVVTTLVFRLMGWLSGSELSINVMTLGGLAVAMGELVDDAIVDVENIFRRLKENNARQTPRPALRVVYEASREIRGAIVFGTAVVILVFLPLFALGGVEGRLFAPLGVAYITSILASLLVSLTVTPVLSYYLLPNAPATHSEADGPLLRALKALTRPLVRLSMAAPTTLLVLTWAAVAVAGWQASQLGRNFLPAFDEGSVQINVSLPPGASLDASNAAAELIDRRLRERQVSPQRPDAPIRAFVRRTGRAELDEHASPVNASEYILAMNPASELERDEAIDELLEVLRDEVPGVGIEVEQPLAHLISHMISGVYAQIAIKVYGDDLDTLRGLAEEIEATVADVPGVTPPVIEPVRMTEELHVRLRPEDLAFHGLTRADVAGLVQTALQGHVVSEVLEGTRRFDLLVRLEERSRTDYANLGRLRIDLPGREGQIELREVADVERGVGPNAVHRENARRRMVVRCNTQGRDLASAVEEIQARLDATLDLPPGYFVEFGGQFESQQRATRTILILAGVSVVGVFAVLLVPFPSVRIVLQILNALPTAFIGGVAALVITDQTLTVASLVGFISLGGIAVRNGILLVSHYVHLMAEEGQPFSKETVLRGSLERLAPVLMTALTAGIGLVPLVLGGDEPGREILYPVATVILGGLTTSTFCEFLVHPGLFWRFSGRDAVRLAEGTQEDSLADAPHDLAPASPA